MINKNRDNMKRLAMKYGANNFLMSRKFSQMKDYILNNMTEKNTPEFYMMVLQDESILENLTSSFIDSEDLYSTFLEWFLNLYYDIYDKNNKYDKNYYDTYYNSLMKQINELGIDNFYESKLLHDMIDKIKGYVYRNNISVPYAEMKLLDKEFIAEFKLAGQEVFDSYVLWILTVHRSLFGDGNQMNTSVEIMKQSLKKMPKEYFFRSPVYIYLLNTLRTLAKPEQQNKLQSLLERYQTNGIDYNTFIDKFMDIYEELCNDISNGNNNPTENDMNYIIDLDNFEGKITDSPGIYRLNLSPEEHKHEDIDTTELEYLVNNRATVKEILEEGKYTELLKLVNHILYEDKKVNTVNEQVLYDFEYLTEKFNDEISILHQISHNENDDSIYNVESKLLYDHINKLINIYNLIK